MGLIFNVSPLFGGLKMKAQATSYERQEFFLLKRLDDVAVLKLGKNFLFEAIDQAIRNPLLDVFDQITANKGIKILVIMNCIEKIGSAEYIDFCRQTLDTEVDRISIQRMCNVFDQLILKIAGLSKPVIHADCGDVISLFLSISLACDYRIIATDTTFKKPYFELETLPKGGGAFFLCKMLGYGQAKHLLMSGKELGALEALDLGIVDQVVPYGKLEETAIQAAKDLAKRSIRSLVGIKRLMNYSIKDLRDYLSFESQELLKTVGAI
jgi:2-(1,2-epoxy-1,2-dihydrophenyl)acetyl-CoA isomerase